MGKTGSTRGIGLQFNAGGGGAWGVGFDEVRSGVTLDVFPDSMSFNSLYSNGLYFSLNLLAHLNDKKLI